MVKPTIIVADDEPNIRLLVKNILSSDFNVIEAADGRQAVQSARQHKPVLVLLDIMMPEIDGYTAINALKNDSELSKIPVVMLTGMDLPLNRQFAGQLGASGYITKPFKAEELLNTVRQVLAGNKEV